MDSIKIRQEWEVLGFGAILKRARLKYTSKNKVTLAAVCKAIGVNRSYWYQMESQELKTVSLSHIKAIEKLFGVELVKVVVEGKDIKVEVINND
jgi:hypothetical protein